MYTIYRSLLLIVYFGMLIDCHDGTYPAYQHMFTLIIISISGTILGLILLCFIIVSCYHYRNGRVVVQNNSTFVNRSNVEEFNPFQTGIWIAQYSQNTRRHGLHELSLSFDTQSMKITGSGSDDIGLFNINGIYSMETYRIDLKKNYIPGTGDRSQNFGQQVNIQLIWNQLNNQFEGKWHVPMQKYNGQNKFMLRFKSQQPLIVYENV